MGGSLPKDFGFSKLTKVQHQAVGLHVQCNVISSNTNGGIRWTLQLYSKDRAWGRGLGKGNSKAVLHRF